MTTPTSVLNPVSEGGSLNQSLGFDKVTGDSRILKFLIGNLLPSLIIIAINGLLLLTIKLLAKAEKHSRFSYQIKSEQLKLFWYYLFNMLIIPGVAGTTLNNIYGVIEMGYQDFDSLINSLFNLRKGNFFLVLILNSAGASFFARITILYLLFKNYLSPSLAVINQQQQIKRQRWLMAKKWMLNFAPRYALMAVVIAIGVVFQ